MGASVALPSQPVTLSSNSRCILTRFVEPLKVAIGSPQAVHDEHRGHLIKVDTDPEHHKLKHIRHNHKEGDEADADQGFFPPRLQPP